MKQSDEALQNWRDQIDSLDTELLQLLARRMAKVRNIGHYKKLHNLKPLSPKRQKIVLENWLEISKKLDLPAEFVTELYTLIHDQAIKLEAKE